MDVHHPPGRKARRSQRLNIHVFCCLGWVDVNPANQGAGRASPPRPPPPRERVTCGTESPSCRRGCKPPVWVRAGRDMGWDQLRHTQIHGGILPRKRENQPPPPPPPPLRSFAAPAPVLGRVEPGQGHGSQNGDWSFDFAWPCCVRARASESRDERTRTRTSLCPPNPIQSLVGRRAPPLSLSLSSMSSIQVRGRQRPHQAWPLWGIPPPR